MEYKNVKTSYAVEKNVVLTPAQEKLLGLCSKSGDLDDMIDSLTWMFKDVVFFGNGDIREENRVHLSNVDVLLGVLNGIKAGY